MEMNTYWKNYININDNLYFKIQIMHILLYVNKVSFLPFLKTLTL